ncbi:MAG TPA: PAS domain-containing protein, partial [Chthoniobacterales bacterium]
MSDPDNTELLYISPAYETIWGRSRASLYASPASWADPIHPEDKERIMRLRAQGAPGSPRDYTYRIARPDGSIRWIRDRGFPVRDETGAVVRFAGIAEDITKQKETEIEINRQRDQLEQAQKVAGLGFWTWDIKSNRVAWSEELCRIIGRTPQDFGETVEGFYECVHPDDRSRQMHELNTARATGDGYISDVRLFRPDETICVLQSRARVVRDASGQPAHIFGTALDITERKREEEKLRDSEERFRQMADHIDEVFWIETTNPTRLLFISRAYETLWGRSRESLYASPSSWRESVHPEDRERVIQTAESKATEEFDMTYRIVRPDQSVRWIRERSFPVRNKDGAVVRMAGLANDITESKEAADALERANRRLRILSRYRTRVQEKERSHLARELHDQIGQSLTAAKINVQSAQRSKKRETLTKHLEDTVS